MFSRCVAPRRFFYPLSRCSHPADPRLDSSVTSKMLLRSLSLAPNAAAHRERDARHGLQKCARSSAAFERHCIRRGRPCLAGHEMDLSGFAPGLDGFDHVWGWVCFIGVSLHDVFKVSVRGFFICLCLLPSG